MSKNNSFESKILELEELVRKLEEGEVVPMEVTEQNMDYHTMMVSNELSQTSRFTSGKDCTYLGF